MKIEDLDPILHELSALKLDVGSGLLPRKDETWKTVDKYCPADYQAEMWDLPFGGGEVDEIWASHVLEHVARAQVIPTLQEWYRVLKPGGLCTIQVPNMDYVVQVWLKFGDDARDGIFGNQEHEGEFHKTGWTIDGLREDVLSVGFEIAMSGVLWTPDYTQESIRVEAVKPVG